MSMVEAVRRALTEVGDVSNEELAAYVKNSCGVVIRPNFIPVIKAAVKDKENLEGWKRRAAEATGPNPRVDEGQAAA